MTVIIPQAIRQFIQGKPGWIATASADGMPNIAIKGSLRLLDNEHLLFADLFSLKTRKNLSENPKVAVMVYDDRSRECYLLKGMAEVIIEGPLFDQVAEEILQRSSRLSKPYSVVRIAIESIFNQTFGPQAGKQIA